MNELAKVLRTELVIHNGVEDEAVPHLVNDERWRMCLVGPYGTNDEEFLAFLELLTCFWLGYFIFPAEALDEQGRRLESHYFLHIDDTDFT
jgi:hypothetical protein